MSCKYCAGNKPLYDYGEQELRIVDGWTMNEFKPRTVEDVLWELVGGTKNAYADTVEKYASELRDVVAAELQMRGDAE